ncbi:MAG: hypothetical protein HY059_16360 [Proteobacteria bacterium]|nr:hypothetical protein [Pseudomonadota bacterium]
MTKRKISTLAIAVTWLIFGNPAVALDDSDLEEVFEFKGPILKIEDRGFEIDIPRRLKVCDRVVTKEMSFVAQRFTGFTFVNDKQRECPPNGRLQVGAVRMSVEYNISEAYLDLDSYFRHYCAGESGYGKANAIGYFGLIDGQRSMACQYVFDDGRIVISVDSQSPVPPEGNDLYAGVGKYVLSAEIVTDPERFNRDRATLRRVLRGFRWTTP